MVRPTVPRRTDVTIAMPRISFFIFARKTQANKKQVGVHGMSSIFLVIASPTSRIDDNEIRTVHTLCYARDDTFYIPESRINVENEDREDKTMTSSENPARTTMRRSNFGFPPCLCQRGKSPSVCALALRFGSALRTGSSY